jgi:hydrogenase maturation factor
MLVKSYASAVWAVDPRVLAPGDTLIVRGTIGRNGHWLIVDSKKRGGSIYYEVSLDMFERAEDWKLVAHPTRPYFIRDFDVVVP